MKVACVVNNIFFLCLAGLRHLVAPRDLYRRHGCFFFLRRLPALRDLIAADGVRGTICKMGVVPALRDLIAANGVRRTIYKMGVIPALRDLIAADGVR